MGDDSKREFIDPAITPDRIFDAFEGKTALQGELATERFRLFWIRVSGAVFDVSRNWDKLSVGIFTRPTRQLQCEFADSTIGIASLEAGEIVEIQGRIDGISSWMIILRECELISRAPAPPRPAVEVPPPSPPKGRRPKAYWEPALLHFFNLIYSGDWKPKDQADVERAMADWVFDKYGENPGESTIRQRASKIWKIYEN